MTIVIRTGRWVLSHSRHPRQHPRLLESDFMLADDTTRADISHGPAASPAPSPETSTSSSSKSQASRASRSPRPTESTPTPPPPSSEPARPPVPSVITHEQLVARLAEDTIVLLDAQAPGWFEREHLPGPHRLDWGDIERSVGTAVPDRCTAVAVYCGTPPAPDPRSPPHSNASATERVPLHRRQAGLDRPRRSPHHAGRLQVPRSGLSDSLCNRTWWSWSAGGVDAVAVVDC
jgi:hypothetical protein